MRPRHGHDEDPPLGRAVDRPDARDTAWYQFLVEIDNVLATGRYTWAEPTLRGIQATVTRQHRVTAAQRCAVRNIEAEDERWRSILK